MKLNCKMLAVFPSNFKIWKDTNHYLCILQITRNMYFYCYLKSATFLFVETKYFRSILRCIKLIMWKYIVSFILYYVYWVFHRKIGMKLIWIVLVLCIRICGKYQKTWHWTKKLQPAEDSEEWLRWKCKSSWSCLQILRRYEWN